MKLLKRTINSTSFPAFVLFLILVILNGFITAGFFTPSFINGFFAANSALICIALGVSMVIITGGIDLSTGAIVCFCNVTMVTLFEKGWKIAPTLALILLLSAAAGALNGLLVSVFRINAMMATFGTQSMFAGLALWIRDIPGGSAPAELCRWFSGRVLGIIPVSLIVILAVLAVILLIMKTKVGLSLYAIGSSEERAFVSGIPVVKMKFLAYTVCGVCAGMAAICYTARTGGGDPTAGLTLTLNSIAACVIGGLSLSGGKGSAVGGLWGAFFLQLIITTVLALRISTMVQDLVTGLIILLGMVGTIIAFSRKRKGAAIR